MQSGGFRTSYRADERIFDTVVPIVGVVALIVALAVTPRFATTYWLDVLNRIGIAIIGALGLNILVGYTGQISIGHAAFLAVGAYSTAILEANAGLPFYLALPLAAVITSGFGLVFGIPSLRLRGLYLAIATLAAHFITTYGIVHWESLTKGVLGMMVPPATVFGLPLDSDARVFYLIFALVVPPRSSPGTCSAPGWAGRSSRSGTVTWRPGSWGSACITTSCSPSCSARSTQGWPEA